MDIVSEAYADATRQAGLTMTELMLEINRFRLWADSISLDRRFGEWECGYLFWETLHQEVLRFIRSRPFSSWTPEELDAILYAVARDNEDEILASEIRGYPELLLSIAVAAAEMGEPEAKWQLADQLGELGAAQQEAERLLILLMRDANEYVRRRSLKALTRLNSSAVGELALAEWHRSDHNQQWSRMMVLWCLSRLGSPDLEALLEEAERDERPHLSHYASQIRQGLIDD